jgi:hypothetical protein
VADYRGHIQYFGSPEKYAEAIKRKGWDKLSDKAAAWQFMQDYPQYFTGYKVPSYAGHEVYFGSPEKYAEAIKQKLSSPQGWMALSDPTAAKEFIQKHQQYFLGFQGPPAVRPPEQLRAPTVQYQPFDYYSIFQRYMQALPSGLTRERTLEEVMPEAERYAQLMVAPQLDAINRRLAELGAQRENALRYVQAAFAGYPERLQRAYEEARQKALESAIARGLGRSGVVDWQAQKLGERLSELIAENEAKKAAALAEVERNYQTELANLEAQRQTLAARQGEYARQFAEDLRRGYLDRVLDAIKQARELATEESRALREYLPYLFPTVAQEYERQRSLTEMFGYAPGATAAYAASPETAFRAIEHVGRFGSPGAYLEAIRRKVYGEEPGGLSDREAAIAFLNQLLWMRPDIEAQVRALLSRIAS